LINADFDHEVEDVYGAGNEISHSFSEKIAWMFGLTMPDSYGVCSYSPDRLSGYLATVKMNRETLYLQTPFINLVLVSLFVVRHKL
jgi:hypothetical protein